ncbi:DUF4123 domain-containing protein (plasmid) [Rhodobacteraceae bacterium S2214]|nr:DUF4123 domain-containing protein [Rhodobacteraceae bacterium S2214]
MDAAKIPNLIEFLGASDQPHRCIYHSNDDPALEAVAPWLVQLDPHADFTKKLFTSSDLPWDFWEKKPGFYLRSNQDIDQLTQHFRRYVQVPDPTGKHMFFRFWEPDVLALYLQFHAIDARQRVEGFVSQNTFLVPDLHHRHVVSAMVSDPSCGVRHGRWPNLIEDLSHIRFELFLRGLNAKICAKMPALLQLADDKREAGVRKMALAAFDLGLKSETSITRYVQATLILGHGPEKDAQFADLIHSKQHELDRSRKILARAKHTSETP